MTVRIKTKMTLQNVPQKQQTYTILRHLFNIFGLYFLCCLMIVPKFSSALKSSSLSNVSGFLRQAGGCTLQKLNKEINICT